MTGPSSQRLLKAHAVRAPGAQVVFNYQDLQHQAEAYLEAARQQAQQVIADAESQARTVTDRVTAEIRQQAEQAAAATIEQRIEARAAELADLRFQQELQTVLPALHQAAEALRSARDQWIQRWESTAVRLGVAIAERLLHTRIAANPQLSTEMVTSALQFAVGATELTVRLSPADYEHLGPRREEVIRSLTSCAQVRIEIDPAIQPGGCLLESRMGEIDARLETMLARITQELLAE